MKFSSILSKARFSVLILGIVVAWAGAEAAGKSMRPSVHRLNHRDSLRNHHRPGVKITEVRRIGNLHEISCEFSARAGFVDRVELRVDGKIVSTKKFDGPATKGALKFKIDLSKTSAGKHKIQLWAWQGRQGYRSVHGESKKTTLTN